jgi:hypothetical protein
MFGKKVKLSIFILYLKRIIQNATRRSPPPPPLSTTIISTVLVASL